MPCTATLVRSCGKAPICSTILSCCGWPPTCIRRTYGRRWSGGSGSWASQRNFPRSVSTLHCGARWSRSIAAGCASGVDPHRTALVGRLPAQALLSRLRLLPRPRYGPPVLRKLYDWTLEKAARPAAVLWLAVIAFIESSVFLIPADVLYFAMVLGVPERASRHALIAMLASRQRGVVGYYLGH